MTYTALTIYYRLIWVKLRNSVKQETIFDSLIIFHHHGDVSVEFPGQVRAALSAEVDDRKIEITFSANVRERKPLTRVPDRRRVDQGGDWEVGEQQGWHIARCCWLGCVIRVYDRKIPIQSWFWVGTLEEAWMGGHWWRWVRNVSTHQDVSMS